MSLQAVEPTTLNKRRDTPFWNFNADHTEPKYASRKLRRRTLSRQNPGEDVKEHEKNDEVTASKIQPEKYVAQVNVTSEPPQSRPIDHRSGGDLVSCERSSSGRGDGWQVGLTLHLNPIFWQHC